MPNSWLLHSVLEAMCTRTVYSQILGIFFLSLKLIKGMVVTCLCSWKVCLRLLFKCDVRTLPASLSSHLFWSVHILGNRLIFSSNLHLKHHLNLQQDTKVLVRPAWFTICILPSVPFKAFLLTEENRHL
ncbi:hypothetical protein BaRGS_00006685 [Batillaria attramentaria]|uniref:Uncharacterized protein n=1 Tax=Batillaria attramentaria TaxID=370345 RepID=A0ABD0LS85_9CAEN